MHIIYHCAEGCHCSPTAAAIHLDLLPIDHKPSYHDFINIPYFDNILNSEKGRIILRGTDEYGNKIYTLCRSYYPHIVLPAILDVWKSMGGKANELLLVNTQNSTNQYMKYGRLMSSKLNLTVQGKSMSIKGTLYNYDKIANIVKETKSRFS